MSLTVKIQIVRTGQLKAMKFAPTMSISEVCFQIQEKTAEGGEDHGLFQPPDGKQLARWLRPDRTLQFYELRQNDTLEFKKKHRPLKVRLLDETVKTVLVDDSLTVTEITEVIGKKMSIKNFEEFSLQVEGAAAGDWLNGTQCLHEQGVPDDQVVVLKKKYFVEEVSRDDPVQLHLVYVQSRDGLVSGSHPCTYEESIQFAALQCQIQLGNYNPAVHKSGSLKLKEYLAPAAAKKGSAEKDTQNEHKKLVGMSEVNAKYRYVQLCRSLKTYGITFFKTKERPKGSRKQIDKLLGITRDAILRLDAETKEVEFEYPLTHLRRWAASPASFTLDFGDYEDEYVSVITSEGEAISSLIAGYIDILLKRRKDTGAVLDEDGTEMGTVENVGRLRGQAAAATTTSNIGGYDGQQGREGQYGMGAGGMARKGQGAQGLQVTNMDTAQTAIANIITEMDAQPLPIGMASGALTPEQLKQQLVVSNKAVAAATGKLGSITANPTNIDRTALNNTAREIAGTVDNMVNAARAASALDSDDPDASIPLMDSARAVAEAVQKVMKTGNELANNPKDPTLKAAFTTAQTTLGHAMTFANGAVSGNIADIGTANLVAEQAKAIAAFNTAIAGSAKDAIDGFNLDPAVKRNILPLIQNVQQSGQNCAAVAQTLSAAVLDPACRQAIIESANNAQKQVATLFNALKNAGVPVESFAMLGGAKALADAIAQLANCVELGEPRELAYDPEMAAAAKAIANAAAALQSCAGNGAAISASTAIFAENSPVLIGCAKRAAAKSDDDAERNRLQGSAKAIADAQKQLSDLAALSAANPKDAALFNKLLEAARKVAQLGNALTGDAGKSAAMTALRTKAKHAAAATTALVAASRQAAILIPEGSPDQHLLFGAAQTAADAVNSLLRPIQEALKNPDSGEAMNKLLAAAKAMGPQAYKLVAVSKQVAPSVPVKSKKDDMLHCSNIAGEAIQELVSSTSGASSAADPRFDAAAAKCQAMMADLEGQLMMAQTGMLDFAGVPQDQAMDQLNNAVKSLGNAAKNLVGCAKTAPDQLGPRTGELATHVQQTVDAAKIVAQATPNPAAQKAVLLAAKNMAAGSEAIAGCAKSLASAPKNPTFANALNNSAKHMIASLTDLVQSAKSADPGAKELEEAASILNSAIPLLNASPLSTPGDYAAHSAKLLQAAKALLGACAPIPGICKTNPGQLGPMSKTAAQLVPEVISATNAAAGSAPDRAHGVALIEASKGLAAAMNKMLAAVRTKDPVAVAQATQALADAVKLLTAKLEVVSPAQKEVATAIDALRGALGKLENGTLAAVPGSALEGITQGVKALADATSQMIASRDKPDQIGVNSKKAAAAVDKLVDCAKIAAANASGQATVDSFDSLAKNLQDSVSVMMTSAMKPNIDEPTKKAIIGSAKGVALATSGLVTAAKNSATSVKTSDPNLCKSILANAQLLASATSGLVNLAKGAAAGTPPAKPEAAKATREFNDALSQLVATANNAPSISTVDLQHLTPAANNLVGAAKATATATLSLAEAGKGIAGGTKDAAMMSALTTAAKAVTAGIAGLINATNSLKPGQKEIEEAVEAIQATAVDLDAAALNATIGLLENTAPKGKTLQQAQDDVVESAKGVATAIKEVVTAAKNSPDKLGAAAKLTATAVPKLANAAKMSAGLMKDPNQQQEQIATVKDLADCLVEFMVAAKSGDMKELSNQAKNASQAIVGIISPIKPVNIGNKDCDDAINSINTAVSGLGKPAPKSNKTFAECQAEMQDVSKALVGALTGLNNAGKNKPEEVGPASKKVAAVIPQLLELAKASSTVCGDPGISSALLEAAKNIGTFSAAMIGHAKNAAGDKKNPEYQQLLGGAFKEVTGSVGQFVSAMKSGPSSERDLDRSLDEITRCMADLDSAALFAAAGQLEGDTAGKTLESCQASLLNHAKLIAAATSAIVTAAKGTPEQLGSGAKNLAKNIGELSKTAKTTACITGDSVSQQAILTAAKASSIAGQQLLLSAKQAQQSPGPSDQATLNTAATSVNKSVEQLISYAQSASADISKGIVELDNANNAIRKMIQDFESTAFAGSAGATAEDVVNSAKGVAESTAHLVSACYSNPEEIYHAAKNTTESTLALLKASKGAISLTSDMTISRSLLDAAKAVANSTGKLVSSAKTQRSDPTNPATQQKLSNNSTEVVDKINDVVSAAGDLPGGERAKKLFSAAENLEEVAEKELLAAAAVIEEATRALLAAKQRAQQAREAEGIEVSGVNEAILEAARAIAQATAVLVTASTVVQKEIVAAGKAGKATNVYRRDPTWARGLISAAQSVAGSVQTLVVSADAASTGNAQEEQLVASARGVAASTARLVSASRAKADPNSAPQQKMTNAAKAVAMATADLVAAAKAAGQLEDQQGNNVDMSGMTQTAAMAAQMEQQVKILQLQKQLANAQRDLGAMKRAEYSDSTAPPVPVAVKAAAGKPTFKSSGSVKPAAAPASASTEPAAAPKPALKPTAVKPAAAPASPEPAAPSAGLKKAPAPAAAKPEPAAAGAKPVSRPMPVPAGASAAGGAAAAAGSPSARPTPTPPGAVAKPGASASVGASAGVGASASPRAVPSPPGTAKPGAAKSSASPVKR